ncbi:MAG: hypothetical protein PUE12_18535 [Oscillospiraceae bacterium]|nr:hypothetical protein [Oscillospiraceae bacterium]
MNLNHHVKMMELTIDYGTWSYDRIALFDDRDITPETIVELTKLYDMDCLHSDYFILLTRQQYKNIFRSLKGDES